MAYINKIDINGRTYYLQHLTDGQNEARLPTPEKNDELLLRSQVINSVTSQDSQNGYKVPLSAAQGYLLNTKINAEQLRAEEAEEKLTKELGQEITDAVAAEEDRALKAEKDISDDLEKEINRAKQAEEDNALAIANEKSRAEGIESGLESRIETMETFFKEADIDASQEFIDTLKEIQEYIADDKTGASAMAASIQENKTAIQTEKSRAEGAEADLQSKITAEAAVARKAEKANADAITKLNGDVNTTGSVRNIVDSAISGVVGNAQTYTTLASIEAWINANPGGGSGSEGGSGGGTSVTTTAQYFDTVSKLKSSSVSTGSICITRGYSAADDGGGAMYVITDSKMYSDKRSFALNSGKYANIFNTNNILCYGGNNKGTTGNDTVLSNILKFTDSVYFPGGVYKFNNPITTVFNIAHDDHITFDFAGDGFIINDTRAATVVDSVFKSELSNITFKSPSTVFSITRVWTPLVRPEKPITNCEFYGDVKFDGTREFVLDGCIFYGRLNGTCLAFSSNINTTINCCTICSEKNDQKAQYGIILNTSAHQNEGITISHSIIINTNEGITSPQQTLQVSILDSVIDQCETYAACFYNAYSLTITNSYLMSRSTTYPAINLYTNVGAYDVYMSNSRVVGGNYNIYMHTEDGAYYTRNTFADISFEVAAYEEIYFDHVGQTTVSGCVIENGIADHNGAYNTYFKNNFNDGAALNITSGSIQYYANQGIKLENKGSFVANTATQVNHGLYKAPSIVLVSNINNRVESFCVTDNNDTTFTYTASSYPVQVSWMASCDL